MRRSTRSLFAFTAARGLVLLSGLSLVAAPAFGQARTAAAPPVPAVSTASEAAAVGRGWTALAQGDLARADALAEEALRRFPRDVAAAALAVDVAMARGGTTAGLDRYEQWLSSRTVEDFYILRRLARSTVVDALRPSSYPALRQEAAAALVAEGESDVVDQLRAAAGRTQADPSALAAAGDTAAVARLSEDLRQGRGDPLGAIAALGRSHNPAAVPALVQQLSATRSEVRAMAAKALGDLDARSAIADLRKLLDDQQLLPRIAAVGSLMRMGDQSGAALLQSWFASDVADVRLKAAQAAASNPDPAWMALVQQLLADRDPVVRIEAARLLGSRDPGAARATLQQLVNDGNIAVRDAALQALPDAIGGDFVALRQFLRATDVTTRVRAAIRILEYTR